MEETCLARMKSDTPLNLEVQKSDIQKDASNQNQLRVELNHSLLSKALQYPTMVAASAEEAILSEHTDSSTEAIQRSSHPTNDSLTISVNHPQQQQQQQQAQQLEQQRHSQPQNSVHQRQQNCGLQQQSSQVVESLPQLPLAFYSKQQLSQLPSHFQQSPHTHFIAAHAPFIVHPHLQFYNGGVPQVLPAQFQQQAAQQQGNASNAPHPYPFFTPLSTVSTGPAVSLNPSARTIGSSSGVMVQYITQSFPTPPVPQNAPESPAFKPNCHSENSHRQTRTAKPSPSLQPFPSNRHPRSGSTTPPKTCSTVQTQGATNLSMSSSLASLAEAAAAVEGEDMKSTTQSSCQSSCEGSPKNAVATSVEARNESQYQIDKDCTNSRLTTTAVWGGIDGSPTSDFPVSEVGDQQGLQQGPVENQQTLSMPAATHVPLSIIQIATAPMVNMQNSCGMANLMGPGVQSQPQIIQPYYFIPTSRGIDGSIIHTAPSGNQLLTFGTQQQVAAHQLPLQHVSYASTLPDSDKNADTTALQNQQQQQQQASLLHQQYQRCIPQPQFLPIHSLPESYAIYSNANLRQEQQQQTPIQTQHHSQGYPWYCVAPALHPQMYHHHPNQQTAQQLVTAEMNQQQQPLIMTQAPLTLPDADASMGQTKILPFDESGKKEPRKPHARANGGSPKRKKLRDTFGPDESGGDVDSCSIVRPHGREQAGNGSNCQAGWVPKSTVDAVASAAEEAVAAVGVDDDDAVDDEEPRKSAVPRRYLCSLCSKRFTRPSTLRTHMNSHTGERPFVCTASGCGWKFTVLSNLKRHLKICPSVQQQKNQRQQQTGSI